MKRVADGGKILPMQYTKEREYHTRNLRSLNPPLDRSRQYEGEIGIRRRPSAKARHCKQRANTINLPILT